jgi:hypothetical protein
MMTQTLSLEALSRATLARQMLLAREKVTPLAAIERLLALQAQWPKPPFLSLFARLHSFDREDLTRLVRKHAIVRGTAYRATIFVMTANDYADFRSAVQPILERGVTSLVSKHVPTKDHDRIVAIGRDFFEEPRTFEEFRTKLAENAKPKDDIRRMAYLVRLRLPLLQVSTDVPWGWHAACGFTNASSLIKTPFAKEAQHDALVLRYLAALGPATVADAQNFTGIKGLKDAFERLRPKLVTFRDDKKKELFDLPKAPRPDASVEAPVRFLPDFDNVVLGHADRRRFVADEHKKRVYLPALSVPKTFLVDGRVAGTWKTEQAKKEAVLVIEPFAPLGKKAKAALEEEGERLVSFLEHDASKHSLRFERPS